MLYRPKKKAVETPQGTVLIGPNGHLTPEIPCGHCNRPIRYYKGTYEDWPWFCSPACANGEAITQRCEACGGAMRKRTVYGVRSDGKEVVVCKGCALRMAHVLRKMEGMSRRFLEFAVENGLRDILNGTLKTHTLRVEQGQLVYVGKSKEEPRQPRVPRPTIEKPKEKDPNRDEKVENLIKLGQLNPDGTFKENSSYVGKHYREVNPISPFSPDA
jgi:hypothetical protein